MSFILATQIHEDCPGAWQRYHTYLRESQREFPASAYALATSDWYFDVRDHRCPHDSWLERREVRTTSIRIRLLGAYHDGFIEFFYPQVFSYRLDASDSSSGLRDWRYDEFRLSNHSRVIHEIEWCGAHDTARWIIEASDVHFEWVSK